MSIEKILQNLVDSLETNNKLLEANNALLQANHESRLDAVSKLGDAKATAKAAPVKADKAEKADKPAKAAPAKAEKADKGPKFKITKDPKKWTSADLRTHLASFVDGDPDLSKEEIKERKNLVADILYVVDAERASDVLAEDFPRIADWLEAFAHGEELVDFPELPPEEDDEEPAPKSTKKDAKKASRDEDEDDDRDSRKSSKRSRDEDEEDDEDDRRSIRSRRARDEDEEEDEDERPARRNRR